MALVWNKSLEVIYTWYSKKYFNYQYGHKFTNRQNPNDCVIVALSSLIGVDYERVRSVLRFNGELNGGRKNKGFNITIIKKSLEHLGYKTVELQDGDLIVKVMGSSQGLLIMTMTCKKTSEKCGHAIYYLGYGWLRDVDGKLFHIDNLTKEYSTYVIDTITVFKVEKKNGF